MLETAFFDRLTWRHDRMLYGNWAFRLQHSISDDWELGARCFMFYKTQALVEQYAKFFRSTPQLDTKNVFELGIWDGGSAAFWSELLHPEKLIGVDLQNKSDSPYLIEYLDKCEVRDRLKIYWNTNQANADRLIEIAQKEFEGPLDCVIDDASHMYGPTKASFETLFPLLRPGGLYIIEDWAWAHWKSFQDIDHPFSREIPLTRLIIELVEAVGTDSQIISDLSIYQGFTVVARGPNQTICPREFFLDNYISRGPSYADKICATRPCPACA